MAVTKEKRKQVMSKFQAGPKDTGSSSVQVALLTEKIKNLSEHLQKHDKDCHSRAGLLNMVGQRRRLLKYIKRKQPEKYPQVLQALDLRK